MQWARAVPIGGVPTPTFGTTPIKGTLSSVALWLDDTFPIAYVPPLALALVVIVVPAAILVVNALAAWPGRSAARIRPAEALRVE